jgi:hypothetical protein
MFIKEELDEIDAMPEDSSWKFLRHLAQGIWVSKLSGSNATKLLKLKPFMTTAVTELLPCDTLNRVRFCTESFSPFMMVKSII